MTNIFFTSDTHAGHGNIIKWSHRPFLDPEMDSELLCRQPEVLEYEKIPYEPDPDKRPPTPEFIKVWKNIPVSRTAVSNHDNTIVSNWNSVVGKGDLVYHLGDLSLHKDIKEAADWLHALNGNLFFIKGNHDSVAEKLYSLYPQKFVAFKDYHAFSVKGLGQFILSHYAHHTWDRQHHGSYHAYGHSHGKLLGSQYDRLNRCTDVGVDSNNFFPLHIEKLIEKVDAKFKG